MRSVRQSAILRIVDPNKGEITFVIETFGKIDNHALWLAETKPPNGVTVVSATTKGDVTTIAITIAPLASEFGKDLATTLLQAASQWAQEWLVDFIAKLKAKRVRIVNRHEPKEINRIDEWERKQFWMNLQPSRQDVRRARGMRGGNES